MITVCVRVAHQANIDEVKRELGPGLYYKADRYYLNTERQRADVNMMVLHLNQLHGVQARILEMDDANG